MITDLSVGMEKPNDTRYPNICSTINRFVNYGVYLFNCVFEDGTSGILKISFNEFKNPEWRSPGFSAEFFVDGKCVLSCGFLSDCDGTIVSFPGYSDNDDVLDVLDNLFARSSLVTHGDVPSKSFEDCPVIHSSVAESVKKLLYSKNEILLHENLSCLLENGRSRVLFKGASWKVTVEKFKDIVSFTATGPDGGLIVFSVFFDEDTGKEIVLTDSGVDFESEARDFLDGISEIKKGHY